MSFYGSVYYQLIDTFHKLVVKNRGRENKTFITPNNDTFESQAIGRKGVIALDSGNRWINFANVEAESDSASYEIWHGVPDPNANKEGHGFKLTGVTDLSSRTDGSGIITLKDADTFDTYETLYDDAGHIAKAVKKTYRLPKSETNQKVEILENLVGTPDERTLPELENEEDQHLYGYVEENTKDILQLENYIGEWSKVINPVYSIAEVIGDLNVLLNTEEGSYEEEYTGAKEFRSLVSILGKMIDFKNLKVTIGEKAGVPENIIDALVRMQAASEKIDSNVTENKAVSDLQFTTIGTTIGEKFNDDSIYDHLERIYGTKDIDAIVALCSETSLTDLLARAKSLSDRTTELEEDLSWSFSESSVDAEIKKLQERANDLEKDLNWSFDESSVDAEVKGLQARVTDAEKDIEDLIKYTEDQNTKNDSLDSIDLGLRNDLNDLVAKVGTIDENSTVAAEIEATNAYIGEIPTEATTIVNYIAEVNTALSNDLTSQGEALQGQIDQLNSDIGIKPEDGDNAFAAIGKLNSEVNSIKENYITDENANATFVPLATLGDISTWGETDNTIATKINNLEGTVENIVDIVGDSTLIEDTIITILLDIKNDIKNIKTVINGLHPDGDPPFPEMVEDIPEPEEPDPDEPLNPDVEPDEPESDPEVTPDDPDLEDPEPDLEEGTEE